MPRLNESATWRPIGKPRRNLSATRRPKGETCRDLSTTGWRIPVPRAKQPAARQISRLGHPSPGIGGHGEASLSIQRFLSYFSATPCSPLTHLRPGAPNRRHQAVLSPAAGPGTGRRAPVAPCPSGGGAGRRAGDPRGSPLRRQGQRYARRRVSRVSSLSSRSERICGIMIDLLALYRSSGGRRPSSPRPDHIFTKKRCHRGTMTLLATPRHTPLPFPGARVMEAYSSRQAWVSCAILDGPPGRRTGGARTRATGAGRSYRPHKTDRR